MRGVCALTHTGTAVGDGGHVKLRGASLTKGFWNVSRMVNRPRITSLELSPEDYARCRKLPKFTHKKVRIDSREVLHVLCDKLHI